MKIKCCDSLYDSMENKTRLDKTYENMDIKHNTHIR